MAQYYVNKNTYTNPNNDHEVHTSTCRDLPRAENRIYLGTFSDCYRAVVKAKAFYDKVDGCIHCCKSYHQEQG